MTDTDDTDDTDGEPTLLSVGRGSVDELVLAFRRDGELHELATAPPPATLVLYRNHERRRSTERTD